MCKKINCGCNTPGNEMICYTETTQPCVGVNLTVNKTISEDGSLGTSTILEEVNNITAYQKHLEFVNSPEPLSGLKRNVVLRLTQTFLNSILNTFKGRNVGTGAQIFKGKSVSGENTFEDFRTLKSSESISIIQTSNEITPSINQKWLQTQIPPTLITEGISKGTGTPLYRGIENKKIGIASLKSANITILDSNDGTIFINTLDVSDDTNLNNSNSIASSKAVHDLRQLTVVGNIGSINTTDTAPTEVGLYIAQESGNYSNIGQGTIDLTNKLVYFQYTGTEWLKIESNLGIDLLNFANKADVKIISGISDGVNILDLSIITPNVYWNHVTGKKTPLPGYFALGPYKIKSNTEYRISNSYGDQTVFFDRNMNYISGIPIINLVNNMKKFTTPANAVYVGISAQPFYIDELMLTEATVFPTSFVPYKKYMKDTFVDSKKIDGFENRVNEHLKVTTVNLIDKTKVIHGAFYNRNNGQLNYLNGYIALGKYPIKPNTEYQISWFVTDQLAFYDTDGTFISGIAEVQAVNGKRKFVSPNDAAFIGVSAKEEQIDTIVLAESSVFPDNYEPFMLLSENLFLPTSQIIDFEKNIKNSLGVYNINIIDTEKYLEGFYVGHVDGSSSELDGFGVAGKYEIEPNTEYQVSTFYTDPFAFYDGQDQFISGIPIIDLSTFKFTTPANAKYARFTVKPEELDKLVIAKSSEFPAEYIPYGISIENLIIPSKSSIKEIIVSANSSDIDAEFTGMNAIQEAIDSIADASSTNRYRIVVKQGLYKITQANEYIGNIGYPAMVCPKDYVDIVGQGEDNTIVWAELPYNDAEIGASVDGQVYDRNRYQTLYHYAGNMVIKDLTFVAKNLRYVNHIDDGRGTDKKRDFENVSFIFKGNKGTLKPLGTGTSQGEETHIKGGKSITDWGEPFAVHNNTKFKKPSRWSFHNHTFMSMGLTLAMEMQNNGSLLQDTIELVGCSFEGLSYRINYVDVWLKGDISQKFDSFNHAEWHFSGHGNKPFLFDNNIANGKSLRIKSNSTGANSKIRFNKNSSAYPLLIQNTQGNSDKSLFLKNREYVNGYIVQDGTIGLNGIAYGCKDLSDVAYAYDGGVNYTSLGKRLGNCSIVNKILEVTIDGTVRTITFNKNYTGMNNAQILGEINTALSGLAVADLYIYGRDYYPELPDVTEIVYNLSGSTFIPKGTIVTKVNGRVKPANEGDKIAGVALDDIPVLSIDSEGVLKGQGRIMTKGYIWTNPNKAHFAKADNSNPAIGTKFKVVNGELVTDANGSIKTYIDTGVISINC